MNETLYYKRYVNDQYKFALRRHSLPPEAPPAAQRRPVPHPRAHGDARQEVGQYVELHGDQVRARGGGAVSNGGRPTTGGGRGEGTRDGQVGLAAVNIYTMSLLVFSG